MSYTVLKCPSCGANANLDDSRQFGFCSYCGAKIVQDKTIVEHRGSVKIEGTVTASSLLERATLMLRDGDFANADIYYDRVLDIDPHCAAAYWGKELCSIRIRKEAGLEFYSRSILNDKYYLKAIAFAAGEEKAEYQRFGNQTNINQTNAKMQEFERQFQAEGRNLEERRTCLKKTIKITYIAFGIVGFLLGILLCIRTHNESTVSFWLLLRYCIVTLIAAGIISTLTMFRTFSELNSIKALLKKRKDHMSEITK